MSNTSSTSSTTSSVQGYLNAATLNGLDGASTPATISGLASGINTSQIISELMAQAAAPQTALQTQLTTVTNMLSDWNSISADATQLQTAADALSTPADWNVFTATSSSTGVTATAGAGATGGSLTFTVNQLATAAASVSQGSVSSQAAQITSGNLLIGQGGSAIGIGSLSGSLSTGSHTMTVTQAAAGATITGSGALASGTTITSGSNDTLDYTLNGQSASLTLPSGANLTPAQLAAEVTSASGGALSASVNSSGDLVLASASQGSANTLAITGGTALAALGLTSGSSATGTDGIVSVDGTSTTLSDVTSGSAVTLNTAGGGTISATINGPLTAGSMTANSVDTGNGSLEEVVQGINNADIGITASAITTGANQYRLELASDTTGSASDIDLASSALSAIGGMATLSPAADAKLTVGSGAGAFSVTSASNTVTGLMPGVSLQLNSADPSTPVTVALAPDASALASQVSTLVSAANAMLGDLNLAQTLPSSTSTSSSSSSSTSSAAGNALQGILLGDPTANSLVTSLLNAVSSEAGSNGTGSAGLVGITLNTNGTLAFDQSTFEAAYTANPTKVANTFTQGSTSTSSLMSMYEATDGTQGGTYAVNVTQAATQASVTGATVSGGAVSTAETLTLAANSSTATYQTTAGESLTDIAAGINAATASAGVGVEASVNNNALTLSSVAYGHGGTFSVTSSAAGAGTTGLASTAGTAQTYTGQDVAGTINGTAATGNGQLLLGALGTPEVGLLVQVTATQAQVSAAGGSLGSVSYTPGIAAALASAADHAVAPGTGSVVNAISGLQSESTDLNTQITAWNPILQAQQVMLEQEYNNMETALASLDSTKTSLTQDAASLSAGLG